MTAELGPAPSVRTYADGGVAPVSGTHVLLVDPAVGEDVACDLRALGAGVTVVGTTVEALVLLGRLDPQVVVVAPGVPGPLPVVELVTTVREHSTALVVAALDAVEGPDAGRLLVAGAGAAVTRPYSAGDLWQVVVRSAPDLLARHARVVFGPIELDPQSYTVTVAGLRTPDLPGKEFELLHALMRQAPDVVCNDELRASLWGSGAGGATDNTIAVHVARLRHRLEGVARIRRLRGRGYSLTLV